MKRKVVLWLTVLGLLFSACGGGEKMTEEAPVPGTSAEEPAATSESAFPGTSAAAWESTAVQPAQEEIHQAILGFCEMLFGSLKYDSTTTFGWDDFDSIEGYMVAKWTETKRECYKIDKADITDVRVLGVDLSGEPLARDDHYVQCAFVHYEYVSKDMKSSCDTRYFFTLRAEDGGLRVTDLTTYNPEYSITEADDMDIAVLRDSLDSWKEECKDAGDKWQFEAIDRIMEQKKVPIEDLIPDDMKEEMERRSEKTAEDAKVLEIRFNEAYERPDAPMESGMTFRDGSTSFWVSFTYLDLYDVYFSDDSIKTVGEALELGLIGLAELDRLEIPYVRDPGTEPETAPSERETEPAEHPTQERETEPAERPTQERETPASDTEAEREETTKAPSTEGGSKKSGVSRYYSEEDIEEAKEAVRDWMSEAFEKGTKLKELYYPGDDFTDEFADSGSTAFRNTDNSMVLGGYFIEPDETERGTSGYPLVREGRRILTHQARPQ